MSHPIFSSDAVGSSANGSAEKLKNLLLSLSKEPEHVEYKSILRSAADSVRVKAFGYNRSTTKKRILKMLAEYHQLEVIDLTEETGIAEYEIKAALADLLAAGMITRGRRRRWQEPGKHYNDIYELAEKVATIG